MSFHMATGLNNSRAAGGPWLFICLKVGEESNGSSGV